MSTSRRLLGALPALLLTPFAAAQFPTFSIDWRSPTVGLPDSATLTPITEGDLLIAATLFPAFGPLPVPEITETAGFAPPAGLALGFYTPCVGHPGGTPCLVEVDAISHGLDRRALPAGGVPGVPFWSFSVPVRSFGQPGTPAPPAVWTEGPCPDDGADVFVDLGVLPPGPLPPVPAGANTALIDGDGLPSCTGSVYPGLGLIEPPVATSDNLDAFDVDIPDRFLPSTTCTYFSLDSAFIDPVFLAPNSGSAAAHGFVGGDVLVTPPGAAAPVVYASAASLGLDFLGPDTDDLDALILAENGTPLYQRSSAPYDWVGGATDMLFFSVRRGSAIVGAPDAFFGAPIDPGDILTPTGPAGSLPGIWIAAEHLGLSTLRIAGNQPDDLDGLDTVPEDRAGVGFCAGDGSGTPCPCGNFGATGRGCENSVNPAGAHLWAHGTPSLAADTVIMYASGMPSSASCLLFQGTLSLGPGVVFGDGLRCVAGSVIRLGIRPALCGNRDWGFSVPGDPLLSVAGAVGVPGTRYYQVWYRNAAAFCTPSTFNLTNGVRVTWF